MTPWDMESISDEACTTGLAAVLEPTRADPPWMKPALSAVLAWLGPAIHEFVSRAWHLPTVQALPPLRAAELVDARRPKAWHGAVSWGQSAQKKRRRRPCCPGPGRDSRAAPPTSRARPVLPVSLCLRGSPSCGGLNAASRCYS